MKFESITQIIKQRRSIFPAMFNDAPISEETIMKVLENSNWAPTHKLTEPWRWKVIRGEGLKVLSKYLGDYYIQNTTQEKYSEIKYKKTIQKPLKSQTVIAICMYNDPNINLPHWEEVAAVSCAVQNMWLTCTALGIGAYWSSPKSALEANSFLDLPPNEKCLGWFYMGRYDNLPLTGKKSPIKDKITWIK